MTYKPKLIVHSQSEEELRNLLASLGMTDQFEIEASDQCPPENIYVVHVSEQHLADYRALLRHRTALTKASPRGPGRKSPRCSSPGATKSGAPH